MRILIADDQALYRAALEALLAVNGHEVVGGATSSRQLVEMAESQQPDVVLLEPLTAEIDAIDSIRRLTADASQVKVLIVTAAPEDSWLLATIRAGALGLVSKTIDADRFIALLEGISRGEPALPPRLAGRLLEELRRSGGAGSRAAGNGKLTPRENDVLRAMVGGHTSNTALAEHLRISENTIKFHVRNILGKLHLDDRTQAVAYAVRHGLVELPPHTLESEDDSA